MNDLKTTSVLQKLYKNSTREGYYYLLYYYIMQPDFWRPSIKDGVTYLLTS